MTQTSPAAASRNKDTILHKLYAERGPLLADGATGTNLFGMGLVSGDAPELWNVDQPHKIRALYDSFVQAGSDIILTNSFGGTANRMKLHNAQDRVFELNKAAAVLARESAAEADKYIIVAGSVGPTGDLFEPIGPLTKEEAVKAFTEQMEGLKAGGADVLWIETMSAEIEMQAAAEAAEGIGLPYAITGSFDTAGKTMMGLRPKAMHDVLSHVDCGHTHHAAIGANCGVGASDLLAAILEMTEDGESETLIVAKANCGVPQVKGDSVVYTGTPELMAEYVHLAVDSGAHIIGGCCGTSPEHLAAMRVALDAHKNGERPNLEVLEQKLGEFVQKIAKREDETVRPERVRRRSR